MQFALKALSPRRALGCRLAISEGSKAHFSTYWPVVAVAGRAGQWPVGSLLASGQLSYRWPVASWFVAGQPGDVSVGGHLLSYISRIRNADPNMTEWVFGYRFPVRVTTASIKA